MQSRYFRIWQSFLFKSSSLYSYITLLFRKNSTVLGEKYKKGIPIEVIPMAYNPVLTKIQKLFGGEIVLRMAKMKAVSIVSFNCVFCSPQDNL